jgi:hypothetical protein
MALSSLDGGTPFAQCDTSTRHPHDLPPRQSISAILTKKNAGKSRRVKERQLSA